MPARETSPFCVPFGLHTWFCRQFGSCQEPGTLSCSFCQILQSPPATQRTTQPTVSTKTIFLSGAQLAHSLHGQSVVVLRQELPTTEMAPLRSENNRLSGSRQLRDGWICGGRNATACRRPLKISEIGTSTALAFGPPSRSDMFISTAIDIALHIVVWASVSVLST
jgi:hypothetical protein